MKYNKKKSIVFLVLLSCSVVVLPITSINANTKQEVEAKPILHLMENISTIFQEPKKTDTNIQNITPIQKDIVVPEVIEESTTPVTKKTLATTPVATTPLCPNNPNCDGTNHNVNCPNNPNCDGIPHTPNGNGSRNRHHNGQQGGRGHRSRVHHD